MSPDRAGGGLAVRRSGAGPEVLLVHGGAPPDATWRGLERLSRRWTVVTAFRRGYPPSPPPPEGCGDHAVDADDLGHLLAGRPHVVCHSYGALGALTAAGRRPQRVRSLTVIEPPLYHVADHPEVRELQRIGDRVLTEGPETDEATLRSFLRLAGARIAPGAPIPDSALLGVRRAQGKRLPGEACPDLAALRAVAVPCLVASGGHSSALERICDGLAARLDAKRVVAPGAGHFVAAAPGFAEVLEEFLLEVERGPGGRRL